LGSQYIQTNVCIGRFCLILLECKGNYTEPHPHQIIYEVGTLAVDGRVVTFSTARRGLGVAAARPGPSSLYQM